MDKLKILVVDDESRMRKLVKDFLVKRNFEVLEAENGADAIDVFFSEKDIALVILDVMMPKMDGWQVCREIRQYSKVPIIMLTARSDERPINKGCRDGIYAGHGAGNMQIENLINKSTDTKKVRTQKIP